jgi:hypothetical protein
MGVFSIRSVSYYICNVFFSSEIVRGLPFKAEARLHFI